ncbi:putative phosphatidate phosphatase [Bacillus rossius redtenbacheri]|uniref:putative phosphatidate phosphatase n=1 Tax=Bacillus rossius redtenbacheri TaxID=93214 RepID=UPI002FDD712D
MDSESKYLLKKVVIDVLCLCTVGFPILFFYLFGKPFKRGFFCDDESLKHPFKESTVPSAALYVVGLFLPICSMMLIEFIHVRASNGQAARVFLGRPIHPWLWNCYKVIGVFGFGVASSHLITDIVKYSIGRLRPHFFDVCRPLVDCNDASNKQLYIEHFQCNSTNMQLLKEMRLSFPSGHSSFSAFTMVYFAMYLQARMTWRGSELLRPFVQFVSLLLSIGTAVSRVSDYKHHWSDVLAGFTNGTISAIITAVFVSDLFARRNGGLAVATEIETEPSSQYRDSGNNHII